MGWDKLFFFFSFWGVWSCSLARGITFGNRPLLFFVGLVSVNWPWRSTKGLMDDAREVP